MSVFRVAAWAVLLCGLGPAHAQVVPDGSTSTTVVVSPGGAVTVGIAPAGTSGTSLNRYDDFNVDSSGVLLDNRTEGARTIVNEVTSTRQSRLAGSLEVLGQTAHVIVANPNGIVIDGGRFVNTGRVALTTGTLSTNKREIAPGINQTNIVANVSKGSILIAGGGLAGQMDAVDLIARSVRLKGEVRTDSGLPDAAVSIRAGHSKTEFDSSVLPGNTALSWANTVGLNQTDRGAVLVDILRPGVIRANRIQIMVTDNGAGARIAGEGYAGSRDFSLQANGEITLLGAKLSGKQGVRISGGQVSVRESTLDSSAGSIEVMAGDEGAAALSFAASDLAGKSIALMSDGGITTDHVSSKATGTEAGSGFILLDAKGTIHDQNGNYVAPLAFSLQSGAQLRFSESVLRSEQSLSISAKGALVLQGSSLRAFGHLLADVASAKLDSGTKRSELVAENGSLVLSTTGLGTSGDLINRGGLVQGGTKAENVKNAAGVKAAGAVTLRLNGGVVNSSTKQFLGSIVAAGGDLILDAEKTVFNDRGQILANGTLSITTKGDVLNIVPFANGTGRPTVVNEATEGPALWWTLFTKRQQNSNLVYDYGTLNNPSQLSLIGAQGAVYLKAATIRNQGGLIYSTGDEARLSADVVETLGVAAGRIDVSKTCNLFCSYAATGDVAVYGGQINAAKDLTILAKSRLYNFGGMTTAKGNVLIRTDRMILEALEIPTLVWRPTGLYNFWSSRAAWVFLRDQYGAVIAETGRLTVRSPNPVRLIGGTLDAGEGISLENGQDLVRLPDVISDAINHRIGLFQNFALLWD